MMEQILNSEEDMNVSEEISESELISELEALLFISGEPAEIGFLAKFIGVSEERVNICLKNLENRLNEPESGLRLLTSPTGVQIVTAEKHGSLVERFLKIGTREQLAPAAAEVLAIVAYRGPIHRAGVEAIRGVNSSFSLRQLSVRGLVERNSSEKDSRVYLYQISADFLRHLGVEKIEDLPDFEKFRQHEGMSNLEKTVDLKSENQDPEKESEQK